ncbi:MAG: acyl-CoA dehydrogenase family protein [Proteobacteria bacterium]|nr:acyl-CoA dehydrogenase family protein [Pseudomonadota bacterium]
MTKNQDITLDDVVGRARKLIPDLRQRAAAAEKARRVPENTIADFIDAGIHRILQPKRVGGYEFDYGPAQIAIGRELGRGCGSSAWVGVLIACHNWLLGMFPPEAQDDVWGPSVDTLTATAFAVAKTEVEQTSGGINLSGRWQWASGVDHCRWAMVLTPVPQPEGRPQPYMALVELPHFRVDDTWHAAGLRASGSNDILIEDAFVPSHRLVALADIYGGPTPGSVVNPGHDFALPVMAVFPYNIFAPALGAARGGVESFMEHTRDRVGRVGGRNIAEYPTIQMRVSEASAELDCAELIATRNTEEFNALARTGDTISMENRVRYRRDIAYATLLCGQAIDRVVQVLGAHGVDEDSIEQRAFRDVHAMSAHIAVQWDTNAVGFAEHAFGLELSDRRL